jgi:glycosyltransferase involved in cell wall biosynthesis
LKENQLKILFLVTEDWYFLSHRLALAQALRHAGYRVIIATRVNKYGDSIREKGFTLIPIKLRRKSKNLFHEISALIDLIKIYRKEKPDLVHHVATKPILYGSLAAKLTRVPAVVNALAGLGLIFVAKGWRAYTLKKCVCIAYGFIFRSKRLRVTFQNPDDLAVFIDKGIVSKEKTVLIKGSGVDTSIFKTTPEVEGLPVVVLASRMLWAKGIQEFVDAVRILSDSGVKARFALVGKSDPANPSAIPTDQLQSWNEGGVVEWWGHKSDMPGVFGQSHIVCLPSSYGEGVPKVLIEAAACGRAIVTTNTPGCREIVRHGENGLLIPVRDSKALADALRTLIENPDMRARMGARGREIAVAEFSEEKVIEQTLFVYGELLSRKG